MSDELEPLEKACGSGDIDALNRILQGRDDLLEAHIGLYGYTPLILAIRAKKHAAITWLLVRGADPNGKTRPDTTRLPIAALKDGDGSPLEPLDIAIGERDVRAAEILLDHGAKIHKRGTLGAAVSTHFEPMVRFFLERGLDPNVETNLWNWTPLMHAVYNACPGIVRILLEAGADPNHRVKRSAMPKKTALEIVKGGIPTYSKAYMKFKQDPRAQLKKEREQRKNPELDFEKTEAALEEARKEKPKVLAELEKLLRDAGARE
jgi:ankyrin repeat protein